MGSHHTKPVSIRIFKICTMHRTDVKVGYGPKCARASFKTLTSARYNHNITAFLTAGLRNKTSIPAPRARARRVNCPRTDALLALCQAQAGSCCCHRRAGRGRGCGAARGRARALLRRAGPCGRRRPNRGQAGLPHELMPHANDRHASRSCGLIVVCGLPGIRARRDGLRCSTAAWWAPGRRVRARSGVRSPRTIHGETGSYLGPYAYVGP